MWRLDEWTLGKGYCPALGYIPFIHDPLVPPRGRAAVGRRLPFEATAIKRSGNTGRPLRWARQFVTRYAVRGQFGSSLLAPSYHRVCRCTLIARCATMTVVSPCGDRDGLRTARSWQRVKSNEARFTRLNEIMYIYSVFRQYLRMYKIIKYRSINK